MVVERKKGDILAKKREKKLNNKMRYPVWLYPQTVEKADELLEQDNSKSRSEFIEKAMSFYSSYLVAEETCDYLSKALLASLKGILDTSAKRTSNNIFRLAVELNMLMHILAANVDITEEELKGLRKRCLSEVKANNGMVSFEKANEFQKRDEA